MADLDIEYLETLTLKPRATNARTHSKRQIRQIANSIEAFGFTNPVLIDAERRIIAGHGRVAAAQLLGLQTVPTIRLEALYEEQIRAYVIADNRLAELAGWDNNLLALELQGLTELDLDFDATITGFEMAEIDSLIDGLDAAPDDDPLDDVPVVEAGPAVTQPGDLWLIGQHRLLCGDATDATAYPRLLEGKKAQMVFTDPPYNVPVDGHICGLGRVRHSDFAMASGEMTDVEFAAFLKSVFRHLVGNSAGGAIHFVCMDWRHMREVLSASTGVYAELKNLCVWNKTNGGMGSLYRSKHELVFVFKSGTAPHINNIELGKFGRYRTNVWDYAGINSFGADRNDELAMHPTVKPVALVADAIKDCSHRGGIILDAFAGSGTALIAAEKAGRRGYGIEIDAHFCDVIVRRLAAKANLEATLAATGQTFVDVEGQRRGVEGQR